MRRIPITPRGFEKLKAELKHLKEVERYKIVRDIEEARAHGDISENAEFEDAKHRQALCEGRIRELETKLSRIEVVDPRKLEPNGRVLFGTTVVLEDCDTEEELRYSIVGEDEVDLKNNRISVASPLGRALLGRSVDDEVEVRTPGGTRTFVVLDVLAE